MICELRSISKLLGDGVFDSEKFECGVGFCRFHAFLKETQKGENQSGDRLFRDEWKVAILGEIEIIKKNEQGIRFYSIRKIEISDKKLQIKMNESLIIEILGEIKEINYEIIGRRVGFDEITSYCGLFQRQRFRLCSEPASKEPGG